MPVDRLCPYDLVALCRVPERPFGKSHFKVAPWSTGQDAYLPSVMEREAMQIGLRKFKGVLVDFTESELSEARRELERFLNPLWSNLGVASDQEVLDSCDLSTSPGFPYYYWCTDKESCVDRFSETIWEDVRLVLAGYEYLHVFGATLKDELRTRDRVAAKKTRVFNASPLVHLLACKKLFKRQNDAIFDARSDEFPSTVGIPVPGPSFVSCVLSLGDKDCYDGDGSGWDSEFNLSMARMIRDLRAAYHEAHLRRAVRNLYAAAYCGFAAVDGWLMRLLHGKSGWENTVWDNFLYMYSCIYVAVRALRPDVQFHDCVKLKINGDDLLARLGGKLSVTYYGSAGLSLQNIADWLAERGVHIEVSQLNPRPAHECVFLSHHLRPRWTPQYGDIWVAAGNLDKLLASVDWVRTNDKLTFEESCVAHLVGLRVCLWPYPIHFEEVDEMLTDYLNKGRDGKPIVKTPFIVDTLKARLSEELIASIHVRAEGLVFSPISYQEPDKLVSLILSDSWPNKPLVKQTVELQCLTTMPNAKAKAQGAKISKEEARKRAEQSRRDKAAATAERRNVSARSMSGKATAGVRSSGSKLNLNRVEHDLLEAIVDPSNSDCRYPGVGDEPNVPFAFGPTYDVDFSGATHAGDDVSDSQMLIVKRADSLLFDSLIWKKTISVAAQYNGVFRTVSAVNGAGTLGSTMPLTAMYIEDQPAMPLYLEHIAGDDIHGDEQFLGYDLDAERWILVSKGATITLTVTTTARAGIVQFWVRDGPGRSILMQSTVAAAGGATAAAFVVPYTGFYRMMVHTTDAASATDPWTIGPLSVVNPTTQGAWRQLAVQDISAQFDEVEAFRVIGASVLCTQASSLTNMNGRGIQIQIPSGRDVLVALKKSFTDYSQSNTKLYKPRDLYEGLYSYKKPADKVVDFRLRNEWEVDADGILQDAAFPIVSDCPMLAFYLQVPTAAGRVFTYQPGASINCSSDSAWKDLDDGQGDEACVSRVLSVLKGAPQHMENETHESAIAQLADLGAVAAPFLGSYGPAVAIGSQLLKGLLGAGGSPNPARRVPRKAVMV